MASSARRGRMGSQISGSALKIGIFFFADEAASGMWVEAFLDSEERGLGAGEGERPQHLQHKNWRPRFASRSGSQLRRK